MFDFFYSLGMNNREVALLIWVALILLWVIFKKQVRNSIFQVAKALFQPKVFLLTILMVGYIVAWIFLAIRLSLWDISALKDTLAWFIGVAFVIFINISDSRDDGFLRKSVLDNLKLVLVLEFLLNLYSFPLWVELISMPLILLISGMAGVASLKPENEQVEGCLSMLLAIYGFSVLIFTIFHIASDVSVFATSSNLRDFLLPIVLTLTFTPFIYLVALFIQYESLFLRLGFFIKDPKLASYTKIRTLLAFNFSLRGLNKWSRALNNHRLIDREAIISAIRETKGRSKMENSSRSSEVIDEEFTLTDFIEENYRLISALGIFTALFVFANSLDLPAFGNILSALFLTMAITIWFELWGKFPSRSSTSRVLIFENVLALIILVLIGYWVIDINSVWRWAIVLVVFIALLSLFSWIIKRTNLFNRIFRTKPGKKKFLRYLFGIILFLGMTFLAYYISAFVAEPFSEFLDLVRLGMLEIKP